jgi:NAD(P)-dependent dehydrogenase (short-subunit alcohol dehydrogenase family)
MSGRLEGKAALVTGGGTGIGFAIAKRFVEEGAKVVITGRRADKLKEATDAIGSKNISAVTGDVGNLDDAKKMVDAVAAVGGGRIDILLNNAGIDNAGTIVDIDPALWDSIIKTNLYGPFNTMRAAIPYMIKQNGGAIINIASLAGLRRIPAMPAYSSSKSGLIGLTQAAALDYGAYNIRCNVLAPGATRTAMMENSMSGLSQSLKISMDDTLKLLTSTTPLKRIALPEEMAGTAVYLASDDSSYVTGVVIPVDGGACVVDPCGVSVASSGAQWGD